jgi:hypothetical protein
MLPESAEAVDDGFSFLCFLGRIPFRLALTQADFFWTLLQGSTWSGGGGDLLELHTSVINFDEAESAAFAKGAATMGMKPFAALQFAVVKAYWEILKKKPHCTVNQVSLQTRHFPVDGEKPKSGTLSGKPRDLVGDWLIGYPLYIPEDYTHEVAQEQYQQLLEDADSLGGYAKTAFWSKAYGLLNGGAAGFQCPPNFPVNIDYRLLNSIPFNNYGIRTVHPNLGFCSYNWCFPAGVGCNTINVNGKTCTALSSMYLRREVVDAVRDHMKITTGEFIALGRT